MNESVAEIEARLRELAQKAEHETKFDLWELKQLEILKRIDSLSEKIKNNRITRRKQKILDKYDSIRERNLAYLEMCYKRVKSYDYWKNEYIKVLEKELNIRRKFLREE